MFPKAGTYKLKLTVKGSDNTVRGQFEEELNVINDVVCPTEISINEPFEISWKVPGSNLSDAEIDYTFVEEKFFDSINSRNVVITKTNKSSAEITIKDYGYYIIQARQRGTYKVMFFHFEKYCDFERLYSTPYDTGEIDPIDAVTLPLGTSIDQRSCSVTFDESHPSFQQRTVLIKSNDYYCAKTVERIRRVDRKFLYESSDTMAFCAGDPTTIELQANMYKFEYYEESPSDTGEGDDITPLIIVDPDPIIREGLYKYTIISKKYFTFDSPENKCYYETEHENL